MYIDETDISIMLITGLPLSMLITGVLILADDPDPYRLAREAATLPDIRVIGKVTESIPVNSYTARLRLDDGTTLILETTDAIPAGVTAVLRRTDNQKDWLCLKALSTENIRCYRLQGDLF